MEPAIIPPKPEKSAKPEGALTEVSQKATTSAQPQISEKSRPIEVLLPDERYQETSLLFKVPVWDNLAASANRLLKFEFPPKREVKVYERLIKTNGLSSGLSKKVLESLPVSWLETIYRDLWQSFCGESDSPVNNWLSLFLLIEEFEEFELSQWVVDDIRLLGERDTGVTHSYYYREALNRDAMMALLSGNGYRTDFLSALDETQAEDDTSLQLAYLACRRFTRVLPWMELLACLGPGDWIKFPRLARLQRILELLDSVLDMQESLNAENFIQRAYWMQGFLGQAEVSEAAVLAGLPCPVKELVIVEGETENLLLPLFAKAKGLDFNALGIYLLPAGGKNHVLSLYRENALNLRIPICVVLDCDAESIVEELREHLRPQDYIFHIAEGEFEDMYDLPLIIQTINHYYQPYPELNELGFDEIAKESQAQGRVQMLKAVWQTYNLGSFDKIKFASQYAELFTMKIAEKAGGRHIPSAIEKLIRTIVQVRAGED